jgi:hypothetical protein
MLQKYELTDNGCGVTNMRYLSHVFVSQNIKGAVVCLQTLQYGHGLLAEATLGL